MSTPREKFYRSYKDIGENNRLLAELAGAFSLTGNSELAERLINIVTSNENRLSRMSEAFETATREK